MEAPHSTPDRQTHMDAQDSREAGLTRTTMAGAASLYGGVFKSHGMTDAPMPMLPPDPARGSKGKTPAKSHKDGRWTLEAALRYYERDASCEKYWLGICLRTLIVLDVDCHEEATRLLARFPCLSVAFQQLTRKGVHLVMSRTQLCDDLQVFDGARCIWEGGVQLPVDVKTVCSTGTAGMLMVWPSPEKSWADPLGNNLTMRRPPPVPDEIVHWVAACSRRRRPAPSASGEGAEPCALPGKRLRVLPSGEPRAPAEPALDEADLVAMGFPASKRSTAVPSKAGDGYTFRAAGLSCPLCGDFEGHTNNYVVRYQPDGGRLLSNFSKGCARPGRLLAGTPGGSAAWRAWFEGQCEELQPEHAAAAAAVLARFAPEVAPHLARAFKTRDMWYFRGDGAGDPYAELRLAGAAYELRLTPTPWLAAAPEDERLRLRPAATGKLVAALFP